MSKTTSNDIAVALKCKHQPPEWCLFFEVADDTGTRARRYADAVAMSIWPSRGYAIHGYEIKVSRSDFMNEMKDPSKADAVGKYCDFWWLATPKGLVEPEELPITWGLVELTGAGLRVKKKAPQREKPESVTRGFLAALIRRGQDLEQAHIQAEIAKGRERLAEQMKSQKECDLKNIRERLEKERAWQEKFEQAYGRQFSRYSDPEKMAEAIRLAEKLVSTGYGNIPQIKTHAKSLLKSLEQLEALNS